jgi:hypothetical protein
MEQPSGLDFQTNEFMGSMREKAFRRILTLSLSAY